MNFVKLSKLKKGDKVAILSPSSDAASYFPWVLEHGLQRLESQYGLKPIEYKTTRKRGASPEERAADIMKAFTDNEVKAIFAAIGGNDQVRVLPYLDKEKIRANAKPFFGYSDNTNISQFLWNMGIPSYYGGAIMVQFAMQGNTILDHTRESLQRALFDGGASFIAPAAEFTDIELEWGDKGNLKKSRSFEKNEGWYWDGLGVAKGLLWGGCVETLLQYLSAGNPTPILDDTEIVLFLETAENIPDPWVIDTLITSLGERGVLDRTTAVLVGRPKAWEFSKQLEPNQRAIYRKTQRISVIKSVRKYKADIPIVQNLDFGHTDPQIIVPSGNKAIVDATNQTILFNY